MQNIRQHSRLGTLYYLISFISNRITDSGDLQLELQQEVGPNQPKVDTIVDGLRNATLSLPNGETERLVRRLPSRTTILSLNFFTVYCCSR